MAQHGPGIGEQSVVELEDIVDSPTRLEVGHDILAKLRSVVSPSMRPTPSP